MSETDYGDGRVVNKPIIIDVGDFLTDVSKRFLAREVSSLFYGVDIGDPIHAHEVRSLSPAWDIYLIVVGERSVWVWRYERNEDGAMYLDETGEVAYVVDRFDIPVEDPFPYLAAFDAGIVR